MAPSQDRRPYCEPLHEQRHRPLIRLATWNCCRSSPAKTAEAVTKLDASLVVLQEARRPAKLPQGHLWMGANPRNGVAVVPAPDVEIELGPVDSTVPWSILPIRVSGRLQLHLLMVWTRKEHQYVEGLDAALSTYAQFLQEAPAVVIGDFNSNAIWDNPHRPTDFSRVARRMADQFGMVSAYHAHSGEAFGAETRATHYFWRERARPFHIDYCFIPAHWVPGLQNVTILDAPPWQAMSDHRPLVVDVTPDPARQQL